MNQKVFYQIQSLEKVFFSIEEPLSLEFYNGLKEKFNSTVEFVNSQKVFIEKNQPYQNQQNQYKQEDIEENPIQINFIQNNPQEEDQKQIYNLSQIPEENLDNINTNIYNHENEEDSQSSDLNSLKCDTNEELLLINEEIKSFNHKEQQQEKCNESSDKNYINEKDNEIMRDLIIFENSSNDYQCFFEQDPFLINEA